MKNVVADGGEYRTIEDVARILKISQKLDEVREVLVKNGVEIAPLRLSYESDSSYNSDVEFYNDQIVPLTKRIVDAIGLDDYMNHNTLCEFENNLHTAYGMYKLSYRTHKLFAAEKTIPDFNILEKFEEIGNGLQAITYDRYRTDPVRKSGYLVGDKLESGLVVGDRNGAAPIFSMNSIAWGAGTSVFLDRILKGGVLIVPNEDKALILAELFSKDSGKKISHGPALAHNDKEPHLWWVGLEPTDEVVEMRKKLTFEEREKIQEIGKES